MYVLYLSFHFAGSVGLPCYCAVFTLTVLLFHNFYYFTTI